ncbi:MAG TPA: FkbM family methyltransferase, partial [Xanthobacteraceae bacterium]|nr:FkbM family methyltransferase [Xanthobacteraceae bacterium]
MPNPPRKLAFITASTDHGTMIVNRFDQHVIGPDMAYGCGFQLLDKASYDPEEVALMLSLLDLRRKYHGDGVIAP